MNNNYELEQAKKLNAESASKANGLGMTNTVNTNYSTGSIMTNSLSSNAEVLEKTKQLNAKSASNKSQY